MAGYNELSPDYRSQSFHELYQEIEDASSESTGEELRDIIRGHDIDPDDYILQINKYTDALEKGEDIRTFSEAGTSGATTGRMLGRWAGEALGGVDSLIGGGLGLVSDDAEEYWDNLGNQEFFDPLNNLVGDEVIRDINAAIDPYHDDNTIQGAVEDGIGTLASYLTGAGLVKATRRLVDGGVRKATKNINPKLTKPGADVPMQRVSPGLSSLGRKMKKGAVQGFDFSVAAAFIDDPEENAVNILTDSFPETLDFLKEYKVNPEDPEMRQRFDAFLNNLLVFEGATTILAPFLTVGGKVAIDQFAKAANKIGRMAPEPVKLAVKDISKFGARNFTSRQGIFEEGFNVLSRRDKRKAKVIREIQQTNELLLSTIKAESRGQDRAQIELLLNKFLGGNKKEKEDAIASLQSMGMNDTVSVIQKMRGNIDELSKGIKKYMKPKTGNNPEDTLQGIFEANDGIYLNRAYRTFDDPSWKGLKTLRKEMGKKKSDDIINRVKDHLRNNAKFQKINPNMNETGLQNYVDNLALGFKGEPKAFAKFMNDIYGSGSTNVLKKRGEVPPEIQELWGVYKDPFKNYARTIEKMTSVQVELDFMEEMARALKNRGYTQAVKNAAKKVSGKENLNEPTTKLIRDNERRLLDIEENLGDAGKKRIESFLGKDGATNFSNPLEDLFANTNYKKAVEEGLNFNLRADGALGTMLRTWMKIKAGTQVSQTVLSPTVHGRNIVGNGIMMMANGFMLPVAGKGTKKFYQDISNKIFNMNDDQINKYSNRLLELGITESSVKANIIKQTAGEAFKKGPASIFDKTYKRVGKKIAKIPFDMYQAEDDYFKILHFEKSLGIMKRAYPKLAKRVKDNSLPKSERDAALRELEEMAATRTKDRMPNYGYVPRALKALRAAPLGDFAAFPWETMRTSKNLLVGSIRDIRSGNPELVKAGYKTLGGMTTVGLMGDMLSDYSSQVMGVSPTQRDSINNLGATWEYNIPKIFLSGVEKDKNNRLGIEYLNLGPVDPYEYFKPIARTAINVLQNGDDLTDDDINRAVMSNIDRTFGPYLGTSMITDSLMDVMTGKGTREGDDDWDVIKTVGEGLLEPLTPGFVKFMQRRSQHEKSTEAANKRGYGQAESKYRYTMSDGQSDWLALSGFSPQRFDISANLRRDMMDGNRLNQEASAKFRGIENALSTTADSGFGFRQEQTSENLMGQFIDAQEKRVSAQRTMRNNLENYRSLGLPNTDGYFTDANVTEAMTNEDVRGRGEKVSKELMTLMDRVEVNKFSPYRLPPALSVRSRELLGIPLPIHEMDNLYGSLYDSVLYPEPLED